VGNGHYRFVDGFRYHKSVDILGFLLWRRDVGLTYRAVCVNRSSDFGTRGGFILLGG